VPEANTTITNGTVTITGSSVTTQVSVANAAAATASASVAGVNANTVTITDVNNNSTTKAGTITSANVSNFTTLDFNGNALTRLNLTGGSGNITIGNGGLTSATNKTLALTINGQTAGTLHDASVYTTLNITTTGTNSTLDDITFVAATALNLDGSKLLKVTNPVSMANLRNVSVSGSAGLDGDFSGLSSDFTNVNAAASSGANSVWINATWTAYQGGSGDDLLITTTNVSKAISLGAGNDTFSLGNRIVTAALSGGEGTDTLQMTPGAAATASGNASFAGLVTGFETLQLLATPTRQLIWRCWETTSMSSSRAIMASR